jgi:tRNA pseudouridine38-40 synthase
MPERTVQLVLEYDGSRFAGWQRQPAHPTVQGELERVVARLVGQHVQVIGAGRTDAGVHARGQAAHLRVPDTWTAARLRRAMNALLPGDVWVARAYDVLDEFHARYSALSRSYVYRVGTDDEADSPFRRRYEWHAPRPIADRGVLDRMAASLLGAHRFHGFAVRGTAKPTDEHWCTITGAQWRPFDGGVEFAISANRFLHHMVRFLVGTMMEVAMGRRSEASFAELLQAQDNSEVSPPAPAHGLFLESVTYPPHLYRETT